MASEVKASEPEGVAATGAAETYDLQELEGAPVADALRKLSAEEYLDRFSMRVYLEDVTLLIDNLAPSEDAVAFMRDYFRDVAQGRHVFHRGFDFVHATVWNRISFQRAVYLAIDLTKDVEVARHDVYQMVTLICPSFPDDLFDLAAALDPLYPKEQPAALNQYEGFLCLVTTMFLFTEVFAEVAAHAREPDKVGELLWGVIDPPEAIGSGPGVASYAWTGLQLGREYKMVSRNGEAMGGGQYPPHKRAAGPSSTLSLAQRPAQSGLARWLTVEELKTPLADATPLVLRHCVSQAKGRMWGPPVEVLESVVRSTTTVGQFILGVSCHEKTASWLATWCAET